MTKTMPERIAPTHHVATQSFKMTIKLAGPDLAYVYDGTRYIGRAKIVEKKGKLKIQFRDSSSAFSNYVRLNYSGDTFWRTEITETDTMQSLLKDPHVVSCLFRTVLSHLLYARPGHSIQHTPLNQEKAA